MSMATKSNDMDLILPAGNDKGALWLGNIKAALNYQQLQELNIITIITVANKVKLSYGRNIRHKQYDVEDKENFIISDYFKMTNEEIEKGLLVGSVLVHCMAGISRSAACVIAYLMKTLGWSYEKSFYFVKDRRPVTNPNRGFKKQLVKYGKDMLSVLNIKQTPQLTKSKSTDNVVWSQKPNDKEQQSRLFKLRKQLQLIPVDINQLMIPVIRTPKSQFQLNEYSTEQEKKQYREQLAQRRFLSSYFQTSNKSEVECNDRSVRKPIKIKAQLSIYGFLSERLK